MHQTLLTKTITKKCDKIRKRHLKSLVKKKTCNLLEEGGVSTTARTTDQHTLTHTERATYRTMDQL